MSKSLSDAAIQQFSAMVVDEYQYVSQLRGAVRRITGVVGESYRFITGSHGMAKQKAPQEAVTPSNTVYTPRLAIIQNWYESEYTDIFDQQKVNFDEKSFLAKSLATAIGRREDQIILNALASSGTPNVIPHGGTNMTLDKIGAAAALFNSLNVPRTDRHIAMSASALQSLLKDQKVGSSDYNTIKTLMQGDLDTFYGFKFHTLGDMEEGGLIKTGNIRQCYAWVHDAVGEAVGIEPRTEINYVPDHTSWLTTALLAAGAVAIQPKGIVIINIDETA